MNDSIKMNGQRWKLASLLAILVASRVFFAIGIWWRNGSEEFTQKDAAIYINLAQSLLKGSFGDGTPEMFRTPGYPLLLATGAAFKHVLLFGILENVLLAAACAWVIWRIATDFAGNSRVAAWAVLLYSLEPVGLLYSVQIMSETLFTLFMLGFVWLLLRYFREPGFISLLTAAVALAVATYVRPVSLYLPFWLAPVLILIPRRCPWPRRISMAILFPILFALVLSPWVVRNRTVAGYSGFSSSGNVNLYFYSAAAVQARVEHKSFLQTRYELGFGHYFDVHPEQRNWTPGQIVGFWGDDAKRIILAHPFTYLMIHARGCAVVVFDPEGTVIASLIGIYPRTGGFLLTHILDAGVWQGLLWFIRAYPLAACLFILLECVLLLVYALGIAGLRKLPREMSILFFFLTLYFVLVSGMPGAVARYRAPIMPLVCIAAGTFFARHEATKVAHQTA